MSNNVTLTRGFAKPGFKVVIDGVEWKKSKRSVFEYIVKHFGKVDMWGHKEHPGEQKYFDHGELFVNTNYGKRRYTIAAHVYTYSVNRSTPDELDALKEYAEEHNFDVKIHPIETWYLPKEATLLWWMQKPGTNELSK